MDAEQQASTPVPEPAAVQRPSLLWLFLLQLLFWVAATDPADAGREPWHDPAAVHEHGGGAVALQTREQLRPLHSADTPLREAPSHWVAWVPERFAVLVSCAVLFYGFACILAPRLVSSPTRHPLAPRAPPRRSFPG